MAVDPEELEAIVALLDDPDPVVTAAVDARLVSFGPEAVRSLRNRSERELDAARKAAVAERAKRLNAEFKLADLRDYVTRRTGPLSLFEGGWILSSMLDWTLQRERFEDLFFRCSQEFLAERSDQRTAVENIRILNHIFYHRLKFTLYDVPLREPQYARVGDVLKTRNGNPFALAFIYLMICQLAGIPVELLCFPGGFVPTCVENGKTLFYINLYRGGELFPQDRLSAFLKATGLSIDRASFRRRDESAMLTLYLESLLYIYSARRDEDLCALLERALAILGPDRYLTVDEPD